MPISRRRDLLRSRRRVEDEGEEEGSVHEPADDSPSEPSIASDADEDVDADGEDSEISELETPDPHPGEKVDVKLNGARSVANGNLAAETGVGTSEPASKEAAFTTLKDTEAMMNGLKISEVAGSSEAIDFEHDPTSVPGPVVEMPQAASASSTVAQSETLADKRRREHEDYKKKRDSDPAFIPNRGAFFMHDHRSAAPGQNGFRPFGRGRGRGRGIIGGPHAFLSADMPAAGSEVMEARWSHDLHDTLNDANQQQTPTQKPNGGGSSRANANVEPLDRGPVGGQQASLARSFSKTTLVGNIQIRVSIPGMKAPITFSAVPVNQHTRLPNHRPPLRRDKPVRVSLPEQTLRYIFPSTERSFIFIPRALRPNQQGFGRTRGRGGIGAYGGFSSKRTSVYGGSVYSPSVAMSRRSSMGRDFHREGIVSPAGSVLSRPSAAPGDLSKPVVRLPPGPGTPSTFPPTGPSIGHIPQPQTYPLPQKPTFRENWPAPIPMHQPRPQKAVSVAGIESPASIAYPAPQPQQEQPFHHQVPVGMNGQQGPPPPGDQPAGYPPSQPHSRQLSYPSQASGGTPLSNIPERSIHAQPFQPFQPGFQQPGFQPQGFPQPAYYFPPSANGAPAQYPPGSVVSPVFVQSPQHGGYIVSGVPPGMPGVQPGGQPHQHGQPNQASAAGQVNVIAHETGGMVYYIDPSQMYSAPVDGYAPASYAIPGPGGMMTPTPEGYYYVPMSTAAPSGTVYYQAQ